MDTTKDCLSCCAKHLSAAIVVAQELLNGYSGDTDHEAYLLGNLTHAEEHAAKLDPEAAKMIRKARLAIFGSGLRPDLTPMHLDWLLTIYKHMLAANSEATKTLQPAALPASDALAVATGLNNLRFEPSKRAGCGACAKSRVAAQSRQGEASKAALAIPAPRQPEPPPVFDYRYALANRAAILAARPDLLAVYKEADAAIARNPAPRPANYKHAYAAIVKAISK